jgi:hypothetical protein
MAVEFKLARHDIRHVDVVEIWIDGQMRATLYPDESGEGIKLISRHFAEIRHDDVLDVKTFFFRFLKEMIH